MPVNASAVEVRTAAQQFLDQNIRVTFKRKEIEDYIDKHINVSKGAKTGALNRLLLHKGPEYGITQVKRGVYIYDPLNKAAPEKIDGLNTNDTLIKIMDDAFEDAKKVINNISIVDFISGDSEELNQLSNYRELLKIKSQIDNILNKNTTKF